MPRSGGEYHLLHSGLHPSIGFLSGRVSITVEVSAPTVLAAIAFREYLSTVFPVLNATGLAAGVIFASRAIYVARFEIGRGFLNVFTFIKVFLIILFVVAEFTFGSTHPICLISKPTEMRFMFSGPFAISLIYVMYSSSGWNASTYIVNELQNPQRTVPISLFIGTILVMILYVAINITFLFSTPIE